jgi:hypothetical protein
MNFGLTLHGGFRKVDLQGSGRENPKKPEAQMVQ